MKKVASFAVMLLALGACDKAAPRRAAPKEPAKAAAQAAPAAAATTLDPASPAAAAQVVETYFGLIDQGQYQAARNLWWDGGDASGLDEMAFARQFEGYQSYDASVGAGDQMEGAAGSVYIEIPVKLEAVHADGRREHAAGSATLRRVNDVPGATVDQLQWRIFKLGLTPTSDGND